RRAHSGSDEKGSSGAARDREEPDARGDGASARISSAVHGPRGRSRNAVTEEHERLAEDVAAYALGSLEDAERARVVSHIASCAACESLLAEYRTVGGALAIAMAPVSPPPEAWATIR